MSDLGFVPEKKVSFTSRRVTLNNVDIKSNRLSEFINAVRPQSILEDKKLSVILK